MPSLVGGLYVELISLSALVTAQLPSHTNLIIKLAVPWILLASLCVKLAIGILRIMFAADINNSKSRCACLSSGCITILRKSEVAAVVE
jgi:hypothetical protein